MGMRVTSGKVNDMSGFKMCHHWRYMYNRLTKKNSIRS